jgi:predicted nucleic acid-binding protein
MIVVADTSPINYLLLIKEIDILPKMYGKVVIPRAVNEELLRPVAPEIVRAWIGEALLGSKYVLPSTLQTLPWRS